MDWMQEKGVESQSDVGSWVDGRGTTYCHVK